MPKPSTRRTSRLTTPVMITFVVVAVVMLGLTITSVVKAMTRGDDPVVVSSVLTGQSMEVNRTTGLDVIRFQNVRAPLPKEEDVPETLDTCMAQEATEHLQSLASEGTSLDVEIAAYANAPNGELWADIYHAGNDLGLEMVESGYAVVDPASVDDPEKLEELKAAQKQARDAERGIFSKDADCTLPSYVEPVLEQLDDLPASPQANDVTELTKYIGELNNLRSGAQEAVAVLTAIPDTENDDSVAALAWGDAKEEYITSLEGHLEDIRGLVEDAQDKRADLQDAKTLENSPSPDAPAPEDDQQDEQGQEEDQQDEQGQEEDSQEDSAAAEPTTEPSGNPAVAEAEVEPQTTEEPQASSADSSPAELGGATDVDSE
ncbi:MAG: thermonuclease family protein [Yaniella sp.]|uniref:thermonuclease family protein n=3 Tax=Yaniella sp. TaxID=2773929 RepID=UPI00264802FC|nr:thermonuclease family protein [Yaniella sp.]MDN5704280.1 thermonuclease family protein [Yaniella sp.]MDN5731704.1 thermonuclease family protein [Yaniella sp.]MDN5818191.1 thermonuclease family protein [Yaniella sp.]MDN5838494.1 thermonuclease family protein [Yaniella sp.]MDN5889294.1 thermonuclease family protein [Yaniella sp.]